MFLLGFMLVWLCTGRILDDILVILQRAGEGGHVAPYIPRIPEMTVLFILSRELFKLL